MRILKRHERSVLQRTQPKRKERGRAVRSVKSSEADAPVPKAKSGLGERGARAIVNAHTLMKLA